MFRRQHRLHRAALWLALSAVVLRSLIPIGFMPGWIGAVPGSPSWLVICPASELHALLTPSSPSPHGEHDAQAGHGEHSGHGAAALKVAMTAPADDAPNAVINAPHCPGHAQAAASSSTPEAPIASAVASSTSSNAAAHASPVGPESHSGHVGHEGHEGHEGHDPAQHAGHRIAAEHQSCPFAGAATPALALAATAAPLSPAATNAPDVVRLPAVIQAAVRRLPPARAPPAFPASLLSA